MAQWYCAIGGQQFGPVDDQTLSRWAQERRLKSSDLVWRDGMAEWAAAGNVPQLAGLFPQAAPAAAPAYQTPAYQAPPSAAYSAAARARHYQPHRGGGILALGVIGLVMFCLPICGIIAWVMGAEDMKKFNAGLMDPEGRGITQAGLICGIIGCVLGILFWFLMLVGTMAS